LKLLFHIFFGLVSHTIFFGYNLVLSEFQPAMSGHPQQPNQGISHQQMSMQNARMGGRAFPVYGGMPARQQVLMPMVSFQLPLLF
jgi:hypothetical protein